MGLLDFQSNIHFQEAKASPHLGRRERGLVFLYAVAWAWSLAEDYTAVASFAFRDSSSKYNMSKLG